MRVTRGHTIVKSAADALLQIRRKRGLEEDDDAMNGNDLEDSIGSSVKHHPRHRRRSCYFVDDEGNSSVLPKTVLASPDVPTWLPA